MKNGDWEDQPLNKKESLIALGWGGLSAWNSQEAGTVFINSIQSQARCDQES